MTTQDRETNTWAVGFIMTAVVLLFLLGGILAIMGFAILLDNKVMESADGYSLAVSPTAQGWAFLLGGLVSTVAAIFLLMGKTWARLITLAIVVIVSLFSFQSLPEHPQWSIVVIGINLGIIWALALHSEELTG